ncbi:hypothetical protein Ais01nite_47880 [Asanoa ishikariensis]|uniref:DUF3631 domain-containing protein n=1 Tax=Asanoa ishikariensis TaxID=137265 RepID=A0A1H3RW68_9ACTN|nr:DUF3631 domain-containing protein [Asanoa ishikariensis]GIF66753.1 hypothetical protein Ais01nite_47880 [Asanoa ishikariensis]SDZ29974.1 Protein of unknown function [Asanoa ishikariensis]
MTEPTAPNGTTILDQLHDTLTRYVVLPSPEATDAVTLWIAATHAVPAWAYAPRLVIRAPEKRCGKSRLLDVVEATCRNPLITVNASTAAVYRSIGTDDPPTILLDEADTVFGPKAGEGNEDLRGLLNAGHQRNRYTIRWDHARNRLERIPTFAMAALAGIGAMPDTIEDRAVIVRMRRRAPGENVAPYRQRRDGPALKHLADSLDLWLRANLARLERAEPDMPLEDRAADTWEPLIAVADLAGGEWPDRGRHAAETLTAERDGDSASSDRIQLLTDCRAAFGEHSALPTSALIERLKADPEAPWADYGGTGLTAMRLGTLLREYGITSQNIRFGPPHGQAKGYRRDDFTDAWHRYCPAPAAVVAEHTAPVRHLRTVPGPQLPGLDEMPPPPAENAAGTA